MASLEAPLDEIQWRSPQIAASMQGVHSNSVLFYFAESPFYDRTSNNAVLMSQAMYNPNMFHIIQTREAFEGRLKTMSGLEFVVAQEPAEMAPGTGTGVWVIRKQTRRKRASEEDEITVHSTYYVVGENIYMAAAVSDILGNRMVIALGRWERHKLTNPVERSVLLKQIPLVSRCPSRLQSSPWPYLHAATNRQQAQVYRISTRPSQQGSHTSTRIFTIKEISYIHKQ